MIFSSPDACSHHCRRLIGFLIGTSTDFWKASVEILLWFGDLTERKQAIRFGPREGLERSGDESGEKKRSARKTLRLSLSRACQKEIFVMENFEYPRQLD